MVDLDPDLGDDDDTDEEDDLLMADDEIGEESDDYREADVDSDEDDVQDDFDDGTDDEDALDDEDEDALEPEVSAWTWNVRGECLVDSLSSIFDVGGHLASEVVSRDLVVFIGSMCGG